MSDSEAEGEMVHAGVRAGEIWRQWSNVWTSGINWIHFGDQIVYIVTIVYNNACYVKFAKGLEVRYSDRSHRGCVHAHACTHTHTVTLKTEAMNMLIHLLLVIISQSIYTTRHQWDVVVALLSWALGRQLQAGVCEFKSNLVYMANSRLARVHSETLS